MNLKSQQSKLLIKKVQQFVENSESFALLGIPGVGISVFLKNLVFPKPFRFVYVDVFALPHANEKYLFDSLYQKLGGTNHGSLENCQQILEKITQNERVVICFGGFDQMKQTFKKETLKNLKSLGLINRDKISFIFGICRRIESLIDPNIEDIDLNMLANTLYIEPYSREDLKELINYYGPYRNISDKEFDAFANLSGGHFQLFQLLMQSEQTEYLESNPYIKISLTNIYNHLTFGQKTTLKKIIDGKSVAPDSYLINTGLVKESDKGYKVFSKLFEEFIYKQNTKLPKKESDLLRLLKQNKNKIVSKEDIFNTVWGKENIDATDWALDALIYRLRRNSRFKLSGFTIESHKKIGYRLIA